MFKGSRIVVVDCGRSTVKYSSEHGKVNQFKSLHQEVDLDQILSMPSLTKQNPKLIKWKDKVYVVGDFAQNYQNAKSSMEDSAFIKQSVIYYLVSIAETVEDGEDVILGLNLTFNSFRFKDEIRSYLKGNHTLYKYNFATDKWIPKTFSISKAGVVFQGWSGLVAIVLDKNKEFKKEYEGYLKQEGLVFDFGRRTVDIIMIKSMQPVDGVTFDYGTYTVYQKVSDFIRQKYSINKPIYDIEARHIENKGIKLPSGEVINVPAIVKDCAAKISDQIKSSLADYLFNQTPDYVYMIGGGAYLFQPFFSNLFSDIKVPSQPEFLNAIGMYTFFSKKEA